MFNDVLLMLNVYHVMCVSDYFAQLRHYNKVVMFENIFSEMFTTYLIRNYLKYKII